MRAKEEKARQMRAFRMKRKMELLDGRDACERCGYSDVRALHFHHPDPKFKTTELSKPQRLTEALLAEARACEVICANCHAVEHCRWDV